MVACNFIDIITRSLRSTRLSQSGIGEPRLRCTIPSQRGTTVEPFSILAGVVLPMYMFNKMPIPSWIIDLRTRGHGAMNTNVGLIYAGDLGGGLLDVEP